VAMNLERYNMLRRLLYDASLPYLYLAVVA
jgi:hypothetical protein